MKHDGLEHHIQFAEKLVQMTNSAGFRATLTLERTLVAGLGNIPEVILDLQRRMYRQEPLVSVLRLLCLASSTTGCLSTEAYAALRHSMVQTYGYASLFFIQNLETMALVQKRLPGLTLALRQDLRVLEEEEPKTSEHHHRHQSIAYATSGYAPLSVRLVEEIVTKGHWHDIVDSLQALPGPGAEVNQIVTSPSELQLNAHAHAHHPPKVMLVCFIGGVTFLEIAALRCLSRRGKGFIHIVFRYISIVGNIREYIQISEHLGI